MFIQPEAPPHPATLKFLPGRPVMGEAEVADFPTAESGTRSPLVAALFQIPDVLRVFFGSDFISVIKRDGDWKHLKPAILGAIMEHFTKGLPLMTGSVEETEDQSFGVVGVFEVISQIMKLIVFCVCFVVVL